MGALDGRVAIVTGAGRGLGREYALLFAREGAAVVVNDLGAALDGGGRDHGPAASVVSEIIAAGGRAVASSEDIASWEGAERTVAQAIEAFGDLHILLNNAGNWRNADIVDMTEEDWASVIRVHLSGHFAMTRFAARHWQAEAEAGRKCDRSLINTASRAGLYPNANKANYAAAKAGISAFTMAAGLELAPYGVRCNTIAPGARTRMAFALPGAEEALGKIDPVFDPFDPAHIAPLAAFLAREDCPVAGRHFFMVGDRIQLLNPWTVAEEYHHEGGWTIEALQREGAALADHPLVALKPLG